MKNIPVERIHRNRNQPRQSFDRATLANLAESIKAESILEPLLVRPVADGYFEIVCGERRWRAAKLVGLTEVPCEVRRMDRDKAFMLSLMENVARQDLSPIEEAKAFKKLVKRGMNQREIGKRIGKTQAYVWQRLQLLELHWRVQRMVTRGQIRPTTAVALAKLPEGQQVDCARQVRDEEMTLVELRDVVKNYRPAPPARIEQRRLISSGSFKEESESQVSILHFSAALYSTINHLADILDLGRYDEIWEETGWTVIKDHLETLAKEIKQFIAEGEARRS